MKRIAPLMILFVMSTGCASTTILRSHPSGATVMKDGRKICTTPCEYEDTEIVGNTERFSIEMDGYKPAELRIKKDNFAVGRGLAFGISGIFVFPLWAGELWAFDYDESYKVELESAEGEAPVVSEARAR